MFDPVRSLSVSVLVLALTASGAVSARGDGTFDVTITNVTQNQTFTPILVASHSDEVSLFTAGEPAIEELEILAESGNPGPLTALLQSDDEVGDVTGGSRSCMATQSRFNAISLGRKSSSSEKRTDRWTIPTAMIRKWNRNLYPPRTRFGICNRLSIRVSG